VQWIHGHVFKILMRDDFLWSDDEYECFEEALVPKKEDHKNENRCAL
jgi:hypothetical protein